MQNSQFVLNHKGLKVGIHYFDFHIDNSFFEQFEGSEICEADVNVHLILEKRSQFMELKFELNGVVGVSCDRCLDLVSLPVCDSSLLLVKFGEETQDGDEYLVLSQAEDTLDVSQFIYEYAHLFMPLRRVHPENEKGQNTCNKDMMNTLGQYLVN